MLFPITKTELSPAAVLFYRYYGARVVKEYSLEVAVLSALSFEPTK